MFVFRRVGRGGAETWQVLLPEGSRPDLKGRFGDGFFDTRDRTPMHDIGVLVAIDRGKESEIVLAVKNGLNSDERKVLDGEVEDLLGLYPRECERNEMKGRFRWYVLESRQRPS